MGTPHTAAPSGYEVGIGPFRDAAALMRAVAAGDSEGVHAVTTGTDAPQHLACAVAAFAYFVGSRSGLDAAGFDRLLREFTGAAIDNVLDQPQRWSGEGAA